MKAVSIEQDACILRLHIQPKASRDQVVGLHGDALKIAICAPPVDGKANAYLIKFLAKEFTVSKAAVIVESGQSSRQKRIRINAPLTLPDWIKEYV